MKFAQISSHIQWVPFIPVTYGKVLYDFVLENKPRECLELGHAHGTSSCYIAAALDELGEGHLTTVDLSGVERDPSISQLLEKTGLKSRVTVELEKNSYNWFLKKKIQERTKGGVCEPLYDFCFVDGSKNWAIDGFAFFLADKLLKEDGWILFDDLAWTYASVSRDSTDGVSHQDLSEDELREPHVGHIYNLLVKQHPAYGNFKVLNNWWGWAQKKKGAPKTTEFVNQPKLVRKWHEWSLRALTKMHKITRK